MKIHISFTAQLAKAADNTPSVEIEVDENTSVKDILLSFVEKHGGPFEKIVFQNGDVSPMLLIALENEQLHHDEIVLKDGAKLTFLTPMSGG